MALDFLLDDTTGDLAFVSNTFIPVPDIQTLSKQQVEISLSTYQGEWVFDILAGVPWLANDNNPIQLLSKSVSKEPNRHCY